jgi:NSS family neurotransmitter:Na+ symporter
MADFKLFGMTMFDLFDFVTSNILMPLGGIFLCLFVGWVWGFDRLKAALSNEGQLHNEALVRVLLVVVRFVSPLLILVVMLKGLKLF